MSEAEYPNQRLVSKDVYSYDEGTPPIRELDLDRDGQVHLLYYRDASSVVQHSALRGNIVSMHLGGPKRVRRITGKRSHIQDVDVGSLTIAPALHAYRWETEGPIEFSHLILGAGLLHQVALEEFGNAPADLALDEAVGVSSPFIASAFQALLADLDRPLPGRLFRDGLLTVLSFALLRDHSNIKRSRPVATRVSGGLAGWMLSRVVSYMDANLDKDISLRELVQLTGLSRAQFFRAFKKSTGVTPGAYFSILRKKSMYL